MIVCICRRLNEQKVTEAVNAGAACPNSVMKHHGTRFNCGQCREEMHDLISEKAENEAAARGMAAE